MRKNFTRFRLDLAGGHGKLKTELRKMLELKEFIMKGGEVALLFFELLAPLMIIYAGCKGAISCLKKEDNVALELLKGFSTGLSFY